MNQNSVVLSAKMVRKYCIGFNKEIYGKHFIQNVVTNASPRGLLLLAQAGVGATAFPCVWVSVMRRQL